MVNFPRGTTILEAQKILTAKTDQMMSMLGISKENYKEIIQFSYHLIKNFQ